MDCDAHTGIIDLQIGCYYGSFTIKLTRACSHEDGDIQCSAIAPCCKREIIVESIDSSTTRSRSIWASRHEVLAHFPLHS